MARRSSVLHSAWRGAPAVITLGLGGCAPIHPPSVSNEVAASPPLTVVEAGVLCRTDGSLFGQLVIENRGESAMKAECPSSETSGSTWSFFDGSNRLVSRSSAGGPPRPVRCFSWSMGTTRLPDGTFLLQPEGQFGIQIGVSGRLPPEAAEAEATAAAYAVSFSLRSFTHAAGWRIARFLVSIPVVACGEAQPVGGGG